MEITNAGTSVSHSGSDVCLRNMIKRSRLSSTRGPGLAAAGTAWRGRIERSIDTRTITYRALLISLMGPTTCDGLYVAGIKWHNAAGRSLCSVADIKSIAKRNSGGFCLDTSRL